MNRKQVILLSILFVGCLFLTFNKHSKTGYFNYHSEIWGDKAGYYIYLPALFTYDFKANQLPDNIVPKIGNGFTLDSLSNKIKTKYTCGIAIMQSPFYAIIHYGLNAFGNKNTGFNRAYFKMIDFVAVFYLVLGLFFLFKFLKITYANKVSIITLFILLFTTNLYYYGIIETGMSHIYSFSLISVFLYLTSLIVKGNKKLYIEIIYGIIMGLIILIRPFNILILSAFIFIDIKSWLDIKHRMIDLFKRPRLIIISLISIFIVFTPQLIYWKYLTGKFIYYSYENEGFIYIFNPQILKVWFSTLNGQFLYVPATLLFIIGLFFLYKRNKIQSIYILFVFILISYLFASWWSWNFGCGFGIRPYVDFLPLFSIPLAAFVEKLTQKPKHNFIWISVLFILITYNLKLMYYFDGCWYGGIWDWNQFYHWIIG